MMTVRAVEKGTGRVRTGRIGGGSGSGGVSPAFQADFTALSALPTGISLSRATAATYFDGSGVLQTAAIDAARFDHNAATLAAKGLLGEEQRTNSLLYSNDLSNAAWIKSGSPTPTVALSGDVWTLVTTQAYAEYVTQNIAPLSNGIFSIYARVTSGTGVTYLSILNGTTGWAGATTAICNLTTTWQRFFVTTSNSTEYVVIGNTQGDAPTPHNDASTSIEIRYFQFEAGAFPTSYIPTTTAAVTRSADLLSSAAPLTAFLAAGPSVWEFQDEATGAIARAAYAAGAFDWPVNKWYRSMGVYPAGTDTSGHMVVGSGY